jgi:tetratricopeptide (TPR) repeat protein
MENQMIRIEPLLAKVTRQVSPRLLGNGFVCWLVHSQPLPVSFLQTLTDMGGWALAEDNAQTLWFFPSSEVMLGLARLYNWARLHPMTTAVTVFEGSLLVDDKLGQTLKVKSDLHALGVEYPRRLVVRVSTRMRELGRTLTGLSFKHVQNPDGLVGDWFELEGSEQVSVSYKLSWLWIIRPQGARQEKTFSKGWRAYFDRLEAVFQQYKVSFLQAEDYNLVLRVTSHRVMAGLTAELLSMIEDKQRPAWPCKYMAVEMGDQSFAPEFASKARYVVESLEPNALHLPLSTIYQIADSRIVPVDSRSSMDNTKLSDLFQVRFHSSKSGRRRGSLNIFLPASLISGGESPCFYCGLRSHLPHKCPSRMLQPGNVQVTDLSRFARLDLDALTGILGGLDKQLAPDVLRGLSNLLGDKSDAGLIVRSAMEVNLICQLRMMASVWRAKGKEWPRGLEEQRPQSDAQLWEALEALRTGTLERAMEKLDHVVISSPKNYQPRVLLGFMAMERDEFKRAAGFWEEAESLAYTSLQRSYIQLLQGRLKEVSGDFSEAIRLYGRALSESPRFSQARYRQAVCLIKSGYVNEAQAIIRELIRDNPDYFSAVLLDPELEGGRSHLLTDLWEIWDEARTRAAEVIGTVEHLPDLLAKWLPADHDSYNMFHVRIEDLNSYAGINNYASMAKLLRGTIAIRADIQARVKKDIQELANRRTAIRERLKSIQREASWFPFSAMLGSFNKLFNSCGEGVSLIGHLDLYVPDKFRQGHEAMREAEQNLGKLEKKLLLLQGVRNGILFLLLSGKYLLIFEIVALVLAGGFSLGLSYLAPDQVVLGRHLGQERWLVLNITLILFSFLALVATAIKTASRFESYKNEILDKGDG